MDETQQFILSIESSTKKILKEQTKKNQRDAAKRNKLGKASTSSCMDSELKNNLRLEINSTYSSSASSIIVEAPKEFHSSCEQSFPPILSDSRNSLKSPSKSNNCTSSSLPNLNSSSRRRKMNSTSSQKLLNSPLYKSLQKDRASISSALDNLDALNGMKFLKKKGLSQAYKSEHAIEKRMCNACWSQPNKLTGCEHGLRSLATHVEQAIQLQGPTSWDSHDIRMKYRGEDERNSIWEASMSLQKEALQEQDGYPRAIPIIERHPIHKYLCAQVLTENETLLSWARKRNLLKSFVLNVNRVWLTNLDYLDHESDSSLTESEVNCIRGRRDMKAIQSGNCQVQSISIERSLLNLIDSNSAETRSNLNCNNSSKVSLVNETMNVTKKEMRKLSTGNDSFIPLSIVVSGRLQQLRLVPGSIVVGNTGLWWGNSQDEIEYTRIGAMFVRDTEFSSSNSIVVLFVLALDIAILAPKLQAWCVIDAKPSCEVEEILHVIIPFKNCPKKELLSSPLISDHDTLLPSPICILNNQEVKGDYSHDDESKRFLPEKNEYSFRQILVYDVLPAIFNYESISFGIRKSAVLPNRTGTHGRFNWHSEQRCVEEICRVRNEKDYINILENTSTCGNNDPNSYFVHLAHESIQSIKGNGLREYMNKIEKKEMAEKQKLKMMEIEAKIEAGRLALHAKQDEQRRIERDLEAKAHRKRNRLAGKNHIKDDVLLEWEDRLKNSTIKNEWSSWQERQENEQKVLFYYNTNKSKLVVDRYRWEPPENWLLNDVEDAIENPSCEDSDSSDEDGSFQVNEMDSQIEEIIDNLATNERFLDALKEKLGIETHESVANTNIMDDHEAESSIVSDESDDEQKEGIKAILDDYEAQMNNSSSSNSRASISKLKLSQLNVPQENIQVKPFNPGEGWKRLKQSAIPKNFARKAYLTSTEGPTAEFINQPNKPQVVGMLDPAQSDGYSQPDFIPAIKSHFIVDITADMERAIRRKRTRKTADDVFNEQFDEMEEPNQNEEEKAIENAAQAVLFTRNSNLAELERVLDLGVSVNTVDEHGNTLFILSCQQGNKRVAKFLLRRRADINAQNMSGNTGLHYCYEYKKDDLAKYILEKGGDDSIVNAAGLTCYEGISEQNLEDL